jgi:hypothetical protein
MCRGVPHIFWGDRHHRDKRKKAVMDWARILAHITGTVDQERLAGNDYLAIENRILKD